MELPKDFTAKMQVLLKSEYDAFINSYDHPKAQGLRVNTLKISLADFEKINPFSITKIPWTRKGFYYRAADRPGKHPYHEAGLYYMQEPSAMAAAELLDPQPGEKVLDLCAAPGGKTTHIAEKMGQQGFLLTNEIIPSRARILSQNVERMGIKNAVVTNEAPARLAERFPAYFDRVMVDAPCSGEGMFRKDPEARTEWSLASVKQCAVRQLDILRQAAAMLRPGGRLVYSTCTFAPEENEGVISQFLQQEHHFEIEAVQGYQGFSGGRKEWVEDPAVGIEKTFRLWPHQLQGEGHYVAVLRRTDGEEPGKRKYVKPMSDPKLLKSYLRFAEEHLSEVPMGEFLLFGDQLYLVPKEMLALEKLKVVRPGWHLGTIKKNRFEPSHALALALTSEQVQYRWSLSKDSLDVLAYLKGESLSANGPKGWYLVDVDGYSLGWGKVSDQVLKNHYPKGLRWASV
ncbi:RsmF rRNA methyltransferase first C-terminal domain-containing protein [Neobacillus sp. OS1-32]|jgi:NOL1/NOP2/sun family putative RNA methylase|uniref:RsmB/NOP family class I SAM-dependent RNA methyltransferase n=1 Tax=Neobacillus paridis TaxID=2803862 RepID=A0ABS1TKD3_9BACI|nr:MULTISPECIES: RsmF rRNA methyltransferase first C-terminal domain-containing protein [Neobacillus]MBL4951648.1 RsmB/NOP family class I SAM-dependent RNA methyltransferase [Neobacillus paridis]WML28929.1 RsmF rRNA methyltransferase first C-terminal domain-containing protein [Neobacillus sp. OS1-32]